MPKQVLVIQGGGAGAHAIDADLAASLARLRDRDHQLNGDLREVAQDMRAIGAS